MKCPRCGAAASGAYCSQCGAAISRAAACARCGSALPTSARYCVQCGARAGTGRGLASVAVPVAAVVLLALIGAFWLGSRGASTTGPVATMPAPSGIGAAPGGAGGPPPLTGSMRDQADRLFERIMQARARGDQADAEFFLPMALTAYESVEDLDADGLFHLGLLQIEAERFDDVRATARRILESDAGHLFGIALEARVELATGDTAAARAAFTRYLSRVDAELARGLEEYEVHRPAIDEYRDQALALTAP